MEYVLDKPSLPLLPFHRCSVPPFHSVAPFLLRPGFYTLIIFVQFVARLFAFSSCLRHAVRSAARSAVRSLTLPDC